jgi:hypothetical protein
MESKRKRDVVGDIEPRQQRRAIVLPDVTDNRCRMGGSDLYGSGVWCNERRDQIEERALARAVRANDRGQCPARNLEAHVAQNLG